ncbi:hypothetical protein MMC34_007429 [Xylographa carneopallida]|nr:hypothetical protein [Xylographa carneopallida]
MAVQAGQQAQVPMTGVPPLYSDTPLAMIHTPKYETGNADPFTIEASHMALSHNSFIRGFNSIYQQAPRIKPTDSTDFVGYCLAWHDCVAEHHHYEETEFFTAIDKAVGEKGVMDGAVEQHAAFHDGLERFKSYLLEKGADFSYNELIAIMDSFSEPLYTHLKAEPPQILALSRFSTPERPIDIVAMALEAGKKSVTLKFVFNVLPVFLLNMETVDFEGGMWHNVFPPFNAAVKWVLTKAAPLWKRRQWRFASCTADGKVKQLAV